jgi:hypothetical protein
MYCHDLAIVTKGQGIVIYLWAVNVCGKLSGELEIDIKKTELIRLSIPTEWFSESR